MSERDKASGFSSSRGHDPSSRQLPGVHELLAPTLTATGRPPLPPPQQARPSPLTDQFPRPSFDKLPQIIPYNGHQQSWQNNPHPYHGNNTIAYRGSVGAVSPLPPYSTLPQSTGLHSSSLHSQPYTAPIPRVSPVGLHDYRAIVPGPFMDAPVDDMRRDSVRPGSVNGASECIGQQHFPGRGLCYVYRDGATCPTVIDGEIVNPLWGTTKAGKARKRLAQACLSCREKKIRCEPQFPRCVQCDKAKRDCVMPATQNVSSDVSLVIPHHPSPSIKMMDSTTTIVITPQDPGSFAAPLSRLPSSKRRRSSEALEDPNAVDAPGQPKHSPSPVPGYDERSTSSGKDSSLREGPSPRILPAQPDNGVDPSAWQHNPFEIDQERTLALVDAVFVSTLVICNSMFPREIFRKWVKDVNKPKSAEEIMVLYSILALGAAVSKEQSQFSRLCMTRAVAAMEASVGRFSYLLAQARVIMTQFAHVQGDEEVASEYNAAAVHVLKMEGMLDEEACTAKDRHVESGVFGMNPHQIAESKRRTVWAGFVADRLSTVHTAVSCNLPDGLVYLRYPCPEIDFERGLASRAAMYDPTSRTPQAKELFDPESTSKLAHVIEITRLIGEQCDHALRKSRTTLPADTGPLARELQEHLQTFEQRLSIWVASLGSDVFITSSNFRVAKDSDDFAIQLTATSLYHLAVMHASRYTKHGALNTAQLERSIKRANSSASEMLHLAGMLCTFGQEIPEGQSLQSTLPACLGHSISLAADIACAGGYLKDLRALLPSLMNGCTIMGIIGYNWPWAVMMHHLLEKRVGDLQDIERNAERAPIGFKMISNIGWRCKTPFWKPCRTTDDLAYGVADDVYLELMGM